MAIRKETIKRQANELVVQAMQPGDQIMGGVYTITGPSPWVMNQIGLLGQFFVDYYYIAATRQQLFFVKMNRVTNRPKEIAFTAPLHGAGISDYRRKAVWSSFRYSAPGASKPLRLNVHRIWRDELDALAGATGVPVG